MPRVHFVRKARKDNSAAKKGESYYWWKFRYGSKICSRKYPKPQQLTQSDFWITIYDVIDSIHSIQHPDDIDSIISSIEDLKEEQLEKLSNMPEHLQESSSAGEVLQNREYSLDEFIGELDMAKDGYGDYAEDDKESWRETSREISYGGE